MAKNNDNDNRKNDKDNDEQRRQIREERERRRREAATEVEAPVLGTQRLFAAPRRAANDPVDANVDELFASPTAVSTASTTIPAPTIFTSEEVEAALNAASTTALPEDDSDALLCSDDTDGVDVSDGAISDVGEDVMEVDGDIQVTASKAKGSVTIRIRVDPKPNEVVIEGLRKWTSALLKDGTAPVSVRDVGIQADFGGASIARHQKYLRASRGRQKKKRLAKKRAMESEETPQPNPDTAAIPPPILRQPGASIPTSLR